MCMVTALYEDRVRKAKAHMNMRDRYIAAAKEKDPFLKAVKPFVSGRATIAYDVLEVT